MQTKPTLCDDELEEEDDDHASEFEKDLELFRERLEKTNDSLRAKRAYKLVPNIPAGWIDQLRERLNHQYQCDSPKQSVNGKVKIDSHSDALWMKSYQRSA